MAHAVSALYSKFNRMSPTAAALAALLHVAVALAFVWGSSGDPAEAVEEAIEFTVQEFTPPTPEPQIPAAPAPEPAPVAPPAQPPGARAAAPPSTSVPTPSPQPNAQPSVASRLGLPPPRSLTPAPRAIPAPPQADPKPPESKPPETAAAEPAKPEEEPKQEAKPEPEPPKQQEAAAAPPPAPPPPEIKLEEALPPLEAPPPPIAAQDFPKPAPPPPAPPPPRPPQAPPPPQPQPQQRAQTPPPPQQQQRLQPSPLGHAPQQRPPANSQAAAQPSPLTNPASQYGQRKAQDDYLWLVIQRISQFHYTPKASVISESGVVVMRITVARDGRLIDVSLSKSSGFPTLDNGVMDTIRQASPFAPLPADIPGAQHTFILPVNYAYRGVR